MMTMLNNSYSYSNTFDPYYIINPWILLAQMIIVMLIVAFYITVPLYLMWQVNDIKERLDVIESRQTETETDEK